MLKQDQGPSPSSLSLSSSLISATFCVSSGVLSPMSQILYARVQSMRLMRVATSLFLKPLSFWNIVGGATAGETLAVVLLERFVEVSDLREAV